MKGTDCPVLALAAVCADGAPLSAVVAARSTSFGINVANDRRQALPAQVNPDTP